MLYLTLLAGLVLLVLGGDLLVRGAVSVALRLGVSSMMIGLTLVGFGTSTPELITSLEAALLDSPGIAIGNVVGSNTANILLILGVSALITPLAVQPDMLKRDGSVVLLAALICLGLALSGQVGRLAGVILMGLLVTYVLATYRHQKMPAGAPPPPGEGAPLPGPTPAGLVKGLILFAVGLALTMGGARLLVSSAIEVARAWEISEVIIGITIVAVGTSLPELVTSVTAALRRQTDIAFGNIIGSNIFNVLGILGVTAMVKPLTVPPEIGRLDAWIMVAATVLGIIFAATGGRIGRAEGAGLLLCYVAYLALLVIW